jgi:hypothetical protein
LDVLRFGIAFLIGQRLLLSLSQELIDKLIRRIDLGKHFQIRDGLPPPAVLAQKNRPP